MRNKDFYTQLGRLLYSIAMADGIIQDEEIEKLKQMVKSELKDEFIFDSFDESEAYYTEFEFEALKNRNADMQDAFDSFIKFLVENKDSFTKKMKNVTVNAAEKIAGAFEGVFPEESELLTKLRNEVDKLR